MVSSVLKDVLGAVGGALLVVCLAPQLWRMWRNRSAEDVSAIWVMLLMSGLALSIAYLYIENALVSAISMSVELALAACVLLLKFVLDEWSRRQRRHGKGPCAAHRASGDSIANGGTPQEVEQAALSGRHISLRCQPRIGASIEDWRAFGTFVQDAVRLGAQEVGLQVRVQHMELNTPSASAADPRPGSSSSSSSSAAAAEPRPGPATAVAAAAVSGPASAPLVSSPPSHASTQLSASPTTFAPPGFSVMTLLNSGHAVGTFSASSGIISLQVVAVGAQAVAQVEQLAALLEGRLSGDAWRSSGTRVNEE